ncbi:hypothetical protein C4544_05000 [candidate division WS5 bacterium]|uniref:Uncharacterized protein n=1 Tax=candidate division WS5 bacterium TaxID=2093353 RepID=A0A419DBS8_9BACT|nr:MAG: hypothetical protein C4544_05000 [candidate division WS5 bacterium]
MLVTTHTIIASTIAIKTGNPWIYLPFAASEHFIFDTFPHFGGDWVKKNFRLMTVIDAIAGITLFLILARYTKFSILILFAVCLLAGWPDLVMLYQKLTKTKKLPKFKKFHSGIQKIEFPLGILIEVAIVLGCLLLIFAF